MNRKAKYEKSPRRIQNVQTVYVGESLLGKTQISGGEQATCSCTRFQSKGIVTGAGFDKRREPG
jgi:hypothetical protein